ncbi:MAG: polymer-forming cytoskeletal protein [Sporomusaceae bacterium]|nr:polymer-forming cytoskeletal protein [Sporomusaceae bacterium]
MFGGKRDKPAVGAGAPNSQVETVIGKDTVFKGVISSNSGVRIDGKLEGEIMTASDVIIGSSGVAEAQINARNAIVAGRIVGNVTITEKLELSSTAVVLGDLKVGILSVGEGAVYKGACEMRQEAEPAAAKKNNKQA